MDNVIAKGAAALVINEDGSVELLFPDCDLDGPAPWNGILLVALAKLLEDKELMEATVDGMNKGIEEMLHDKNPGEE